MSGMPHGKVKETHFRCTTRQKASEGAFHLFAPAERHLKYHKALPEALPSCSSLTPAWEGFSTAPGLGALHLALRAEAGQGKSCSAPQKSFPPEESSCY